MSTLQEQQYEQEREILGQAVAGLAAAVTVLNGQTFSTQQVRWAVEVAARHIQQAQDRIAPFAPRSAQAPLTPATVQADETEWHEPPDMPPGPMTYIGFWAEDGLWVAEYWPSWISDETGQYKEKWLTHPDGSLRPDPVAWRYLPLHVPEKYLKQATYLQDDPEES